MSKEEMEQVLKIALTFVEQLTNEQYEKLVSNEASICYVEEQRKGSSDDEFEKWKVSIIEEQDVEKVLRRKTKKEIVRFCTYYNIPTVTKDTKAILYEKISEYFQIGANTLELEKKDRIAEIGKELEKFDDAEQALGFLGKEKSLQTKSNVMKLAKSLDVFVNQKQSKQDIINRIVDSVVGAKVRARVIRGG
ncbi:hypothetical protein [Halalkalibacter alkaliphilus]|uniref:Uncharacterized protein n=1 Tax=Halalkalibacter alkaliphilus TaxID=2917993 RepID=A0A9X2A175_9BACI|nr:hypothetical protein [Halalkalibacter alkaliphilus]MCL7746830.1 hypothetical protein [Halalkalibacter alkaliphilus]